MLLYDGLAAHTLVARLFILERKGLTLDTQHVDVLNLENRGIKYRTEVSERGEVPALRLDDGTVLTETIAICQFLDEIATAGVSLFGVNPHERAITWMWLRRVDLDIVQPLIRSFRDDPASVDFYRGNRIPVPEASLANKIATNQGLNLLDDHLVLSGKEYICGDRFSAADIWLYGIVAMMGQAIGWLNPPGRKGVAAWMTRMEQRDASAKAMQVFDSKIVV